MNQVRMMDRWEEPAAVSESAESGNKQQMDQARERLTQASHKLAEQMYKAAQPQGDAPGAQARPGAGAGSAPGGDGQAKKDEGVIDAEYVDVEDKK